MLPAALWLLSACASGPSTTPRHYPALPGAGSAVAVGGAFEPDPALRAFAASCRAHEPELANALDDDCDGRVDGAGASAIAVAYPRSTPLRFALRTEGRPERPLAEPSCAGDSGFCTLRIASAAQGGAPSTLIARRSDPAQRPAAVLVTVQSAGKVVSYIAPPDAPDQAERVLGRIGAQ